MALRCAARCSLASSGSLQALSFSRQSFLPGALQPPHSMHAVRSTGQHGCNHVEALCGSYRRPLSPFATILAFLCLNQIMLVVTMSSIQVEDWRTIHQRPQTQATPKTQPWHLHFQCFLLCRGETAPKSSWYRSPAVGRGLQVQGALCRE